MRMTITTDDEGRIVLHAEFEGRMVETPDGPDVEGIDIAGESWCLSYEACEESD